MVSITHKDDEIVESKEFTPISSPKNTYDTNSDELNDTDEEEVHKDFCLYYCCMAVELEDAPERWSCNDCVEDDQIVESKEITPISSPKNTDDMNIDELNDTDEEELTFYLSLLMVLDNHQ
ncbi:BnaAnng28160D [Brassica napus]|uniref:BnaAnng28160D protein n=1 Tax=Brassica napus TaxID=3708 RepID=A0A078JMI0_BRANA|nr:BnaAnng28160D [Brassica napus]